MKKEISGWVSADALKGNVIAEHNNFNFQVDRVDSHFNLRAKIIIDVPDEEVLLTREQVRCACAEMYRNTREEDDLETHIKAFMDSLPV